MSFNQFRVPDVCWQNVSSMFGLFKKKDPITEIKKQATQLEEEAYQLSRTDRKAADLKTAEAAALWDEVKRLESDAKTNNG